MPCNQTTQLQHLNLCPKFKKTSKIQSTGTENFSQPRKNRSICFLMIVIPTTPREWKASFSQSCIGRKKLPYRSCQAYMLKDAKVRQVEAEFLRVNSMEQLYIQERMICDDEHLRSVNTFGHVSNVINKVNNRHDNERQLLTKQREEGSSGGSVSR